VPERRRSCPRIRIPPRAVASPSAAAVASQAVVRLPEHLLDSAISAATSVPAVDDASAAPSSASPPSLHRARLHSTGDGGRRRSHLRVPLLEMLLLVPPRAAAVAGIAGELARAAAARFEFERAGARIWTRSINESDPLALQSRPSNA
jgi:hypothetical protein